MHSGKLNQRICIEQPVLVRNAMEEMELTYEPYVHVWAQIQPIRGKELMSANALQSEVTHRIWIRYYPGITARHRISMGRKNRRIMDIQSVINRDEGNAMIEILAFEWDSENVNKAS